MAISVVFVVVATTFPPLTSVVLMKPSRHQRRPHHQFGQIVQLSERDVESCNPFALGTSHTALRFAFIAFDGIELSRQFPNHSAANVLANNAAILAS